MPVKNFLPTEVHSAGLTALIQNLGRDCHPTQFIREFTKNGIEACQRTSNGAGKVVVDYNRSLYDSKRLHKISFIDTGDGMSAHQMLNLLNNLSASGEVRNQHQNYGVGAKISALTRNHCGILYESWQGGVGNAVFIKYNDEQGIYGVQGVATSDGQMIYAVPIPKEIRPPEPIEQHGTRVTLFGMTENQDTMTPPDGIPGIRESWLTLFLNTRYFRIPKGIEIHSRIGYYRDNNPKHNYLREITGQKSLLDAKAELKGDVRLSDANLYWWVMPKGVDGHGRELLKGHTALINEDEIFDVSDARSNRVAYFGVIVGRDRVVIYVEPTNVVQNTARTNLVRPDGSAIVWDRWQDEFRTNMPADLRKFLDDLQNEGSTESHTDTIKERLKGLKELYKLSRYKANPNGTLKADPDSVATFSTGSTRTGRGPGGTGTTSSRGSRTGDLSTELLTALVESNTSVQATSVDPDPFPRVKWVKASEGQDGLIDRAAEYIQTENLILANSEFQGLQDLIKYLSKNYLDLPEVNKIIDDEVRNAFEQALTECVAGALSLKNRPHWNPSDFEAAISREALTTAVMQRYWMVSYIKRLLGNKIKGYNDSASATP